MARIVYGVHGTGRGHAVRALTLAQHAPSHDFLFFSHGEAARLLGKQFEVIECPNPVTPVRAHRVDSISAIVQSALTLAQSRSWSSKVQRAMERFGPDVAITDYEFFVPRVARKIGVPCLSFDNQHAITMGRIDCPIQQTPSRLATSFAIKCLFSGADQYLVSNFFEVPLRTAGDKVRWARPLLRREVLQLSSEQGPHVVAYQGYPTFPGFFDTLAGLDRPVHVYGQGSKPPDRRVSFHDFDERLFLNDLATCAFVACGGGHTLISEALYLGKPVLSIPVSGAFEQFINGFYLSRCGYGEQTSIEGFSINMLRYFEKNLDAYRANICEARFTGNEATLADINDFISGRWRPPDASGARRPT